jgi:hypothetical protein
MNLEEAIKVLKEWIRIDRMTREGEEHSDYDDFCEEKCIAIETVIEALDEKDEIIKDMQDELKHIPSIVSETM